MPKLSFNGLGIHLKVADISASRGFYEGLLGMAPIFAYGDKDFLSTVPEDVPTAPERYRGVTYEPVSNAPLEIADGHVAVKDKGVFAERIDGPKVSAMIRVESFVPILSETDVRPTFPVRHYYWGTLEMALRDPDGWVLILVAPYSDGELERLREFVDVEEIAPGG